MKSGYVTSTEGAVVLASGVPKTILGIAGHANRPLDLVGWSVSFDGITASAVPVLCEICYCTFATNAPGTASTSTTIDQQYGRAITAGFTAAKTWTTEPTVITPYREFLLTPAGGNWDVFLPFGQTWDAAVSQGFVIRCNAPAGVNVRADIRVEPS